MIQCGMCCHEASTKYIATGYLMRLHPWSPITFCRWCEKGTQLKKEQHLTQMLKGEPIRDKPTF